MPTFLILKNRVEVARVQGADPRSLTSAVEKYASEAKSAGATFATSGKGYTLGSAAAATATAAAAGPAAAKYVRNGQVLSNVPFPARLRGFFNAFVVFVGLYLTSLFSLDAIPAAENSPFNVTRGAAGTRPNVRSAGGGSGHAAPSPGGPAGRRLGTLDSIRGGGG